MNVSENNKGILIMTTIEKIQRTERPQSHEVAQKNL